MGTKTIGIREETYERLKARKRDDESFTDLVERLLGDSTVDWRDGFDTLGTEEMENLERAASRSREAGGAGLASRQRKTLESLAASDDSSDETA